MKKLLLIFTSFLLLNSYSQTKNTVYFLINKKDTLIEKQISTKTNEYEGYRIINEKRVVKEVQMSSKLGGNDIEYNTFESYSFSFNRKNDIVITKAYLKKLNIIKDRRELIDSIKNSGKYWIDFVFIEPTKSDIFILRKVDILTFE